MSEARDYQLGDRVAAASGGREMTVCQISSDFSSQVESIECGWFESGIPQTARFAPSDLRLVSKADRGRAQMKLFSAE